MVPLLNKEIPEDKDFPLYPFALGMLIVGCLGYHIVKFIIEKCQSTKKIDDLTYTSFNQQILVNPSPSSVFDKARALPKNSSDFFKSLIFIILGIKTNGKEIRNLSKIILKDINNIDESLVKINSIRYKLRSIKTDYQKVEEGLNKALDRAKEEVDRAQKKVNSAKEKKSQAQEELHKAEKADKAAVKIQKIAKGFLVRIKPWEMTIETKVYQHLRSSQIKITNLPQAESGKTAVYFIHSIQIILKQSQFACKTRLKTMVQARELIKKKEFNYLIVPKAIEAQEFPKGFLIEECLPIQEGMFKQFALYSDNKESFTPAIKEFCQLVLNNKFSDLTGGKFRYSMLANVSLPRTDNICLFRKEPDFFGIGLVDLESFQINTPSDQEFTDQLKSLVSLFPYHLETILEIATKIRPVMSEKMMEDLEKIKTGVLNFFLLFDRFSNLLTEKKIDLSKPPERKLEISEERKKEIAKNAVALLKQEITKNQVNCLINPYIIENFSVCEEKIQQVIPQVIDLIFKYLDESLIDNAKFFNNYHARIVSLATWSYNGGYIHFIQQEIKPLLNSFTSDTRGNDQVWFARYLESIILPQMVGKEIFYYCQKNPLEAATETLVFCCQQNI